MWFVGWYVGCWVLGVVVLGEGGRGGVVFVGGGF